MSALSRPRRRGLGLARLETSAMAKKPTTEATRCPRSRPARHPARTYLHPRITRLRGEALGGATVGAAVEEVEDDPLAEAALADLQRLAEQLGDLLEQEDAGGEDA